MSRLGIKLQNSFVPQIKSMKKILFAVLWLFSSLKNPAPAQAQFQKLSLEEAINAAISNNNAVQQASGDEKIASDKYRESSAIFLPRLNFSYTSILSNNPLNAFGFKLQQKDVSAADFNPDVLNHPAAASDFTTKLEIQQPLLNIDMLYQRKAAARQVEMYSFMLRRTKEYLAFETEKTYLQLQMAYAADSVLKEALNASKAFYKSAGDYYAQGLIQKSDLLNAALHVMNIETDLSKSTSAIGNISDALSLLMGKQPGFIYIIESISRNSGDPSDSIALSGDRADFKAMQKGIESYEMMIKSSRMSYLPRINAFASWQLNDKSMFGFNANAYLAGVQLSWNIFNGNRTKNLISRQSHEKDKLSLQLQKEREEAQVNINQTMRQMTDADFAMKQQSLAIQQAAEALRVLQNRYTLGLAKATDVLLAQTQLSQQKLGYVEAIFNYNMAAAYLQFLTKGKQ